MGLSTSLLHPDVLNPRFQKIFDDRLKQLPDMIPDLFSMAEHQGRDTIRWSEEGAVEDFTAFTGSVDYDRRYQGYDVVATFAEFTRGIQVERKLFDDDQFQIFDQRPAGMARAANRTRQKHAARVHNVAFADDQMFYVNSEAVALCSNSHTNTSGASTANGFDNLSTDAFSAVALETARQQMIGFRGDRAERIDVVPDEIWVAPANTESAWEVVNSHGKVDTANNNRNFHEGSYKVVTWQYQTDGNNWFLHDSTLRSEMLLWSDRVAIEFAMIEDFDTLVAKWRGYMRYAWAFNNWRWILGAQVS